MLGARSPTGDLGRPDAALEELLFGSPPSQPLIRPPAPPPLLQACGRSVLWEATGPWVGRGAALGHGGRRAPKAVVRGQPVVVGAGTGEGTLRAGEGLSGPAEAACSPPKRPRSRLCKLAFPRS